MGNSRIAEELRHRPLVQRTRASEMTHDRNSIPKLKILEFDLLFLTKLGVTILKKFWNFVRAQICPSVVTVHTKEWGLLFLIGVKDQCKIFGSMFFPHVFVH